MELSILDLPVESLFHIVSRLHYSDILRLAQTCSSLHLLSSDIWKILYQRDISARVLNSSYLQAYRQVIQNTKICH